MKTVSLYRQHSSWILREFVSVIKILKCKRIEETVLRILRQVFIFVSLSYEWTASNKANWTIHVLHGLVDHPSNYCMKQIVKLIVCFTVPITVGSIQISLCFILSNHVIFKAWNYRKDLRTNCVFQNALPETYSVTSFHRKNLLKFMCFICQRKTRFWPTIKIMLKIDSKFLYFFSRFSRLLSICDSASSTGQCHYSCDNKIKDLCYISRIDSKTDKLTNTSIATTDPR